MALVQATADRHQFRVLPEPPALVGQWDAIRLQRLLDNLLSNAVKYSPRGGVITVSLGIEAEENGRRYARLSVQDEGIGIPAAALPHIFERFYRARNVTERIAGTGLGLAGIKQIVEQHGGTIALTSQEGRGTKVSLCLPLP